MAHYAIINEQNQVIAVNTGVDETITQTDLDGSTVGGSTEAWEAFYTAQLNNANLFVLRCSYHGNIRGVYPGIGWTYDANLDQFISPTIEQNDDKQEN